MSDLTARQQQILEVVDAHLVRHGYPPTVREIGEAVGLTSSSTVHGTSTTTVYGNMISNANIDRISAAMAHPRVGSAASP